MGLAHPKSRAGVVWTLGLIGDEKIIPFITTFLKDPESIVRSASAGALGKFGLKKMVPVLVEALNDPDERVRAALVNALRQSHEASVIEKLLPMFQSEPDEFVRQRIALTVGSLNICDTPQNQKVSEVIFSLTQMIKQWVENTRNEKSRMAGFIALVLLHDDSIFQKILIDIQTPSLNSLMQELLKELFPEVQNRFFSFLSLDPKLFWNHNSPKMAKHYSALLKSNRDASQRVRAIEALKFLNERSSLPEIEASFTKDPNPQVRAAALETFGSWLESTERLEKIRAAFFDSSEEVHACALSLIHQLKPQDLREVREKLIPLLDINQESIRIPISKLLSHLYYQDWHSLVDQLIGTEKKTRIVGLLETLSTIQDPQLSALFIQFMRHQDPEIRGATATAVANGTNFLSKEEWKSAFDDPQELIRLAAIRGLGKQMDDEVIQFFIDRAEDPSSKVRKEISLFLGKQKSSTLDRQISSLRHLSQNPETEVQIMSFISLFRLGEKNLTPKIISLISQQEKKEMEKLNRDLEKENFFEELITTLQRDHEVVRRKEAMEILATLNFCRYLDELTRCLKDPASEVRIKAMEILAKNEGEHLRKPTALLIQDPGEKGSTAAEKIKPGTIQEES